MTFKNDIFSLLSCLIIGLSCLSAALTPLYAQSSQATPMDINQLTPELRFSLEFSHVVIEAGQEIEQAFPEKMQRLASGADLTELEARTLFEFQNERFSDFFERHIFTSEVPSEQRMRFRQLMRNFNQTHVTDLLKGQMLRARVFFRRSGMGMAVALTIASLINYVLPVIMIQTGYVQLLPLVVSTPWTFIFGAIPSTLQKLWTRQQIISALGGRAHYQNYKEFVDGINRKLLRKTPDHFLVPVALGNSQMRVVSVRGTSLMQSLLGRLGFFRGSMTVNSIRSFLILKAADELPAIKHVFALEVPSQVKVGLLVKTIYEYGGEELIGDFERHFSSSIQDLAQYRPWGGLKDWALRMRSAQNINDVNRILAEVPDHVDTREILGVWRRILLPAYAETFDFDYGAYRTLVTDFEVFNARVHHEGWSSWGETRFYFQEYLLNASRKKSWRGCSPTPREVLQFLL